MDTGANDATRFCRLLARALRRRLQPADGFGRLPEARHGPSSEEAARCVVRAAGASGCGGLFDREALPCSVGAEDGAIYRMWRWLSVAWPLNILLYVLTLPLAELLWCLASRHYLRVRSAAPHVVRLGHADAAIALRYYRRLPKERTPAQLEALLRRWFHGRMPTREQVTSFLGDGAPQPRARCEPRFADRAAQHGAGELKRRARWRAQRKPIKEGTASQAAVAGTEFCQELCVLSLRDLLCDAA